VVVLPVGRPTALKQQLQCRPKGLALLVWAAVVAMAVVAAVVVRVVVVVVEEKLSRQTTC